MGTVWGWLSVYNDPWHKVFGWFSKCGVKNLPGSAHSSLSLSLLWDKLEHQILLQMRFLAAGKHSSSHITCVWDAHGGVNPCMTWNEDRKISSKIIFNEEVCPCTYLQIDAREKKIHFVIHKTLKYWIAICGRANRDSAFLLGERFKMRQEGISKRVYLLGQLCLNPLERKKRGDS